MQQEQRSLSKGKYIKALKNFRHSPSARMLLPPQQLLLSQRIISFLPFSFSFFLFFFFYL